MQVHFIPIVPLSYKLELIYCRPERFAVLQRSYLQLAVCLQNLALPEKPVFRKGSESCVLTEERYHVVYTRFRLTDFRVRGTKSFSSRVFITGEPLRLRSRV